MRASFSAIWGHLWNADAITERNDRLSNELGVARTPVADEALAIWGEVGLDVAPWLCLDADHRLEAFARVDRYDTMFSAGADIFDNPRFARTVFTGGAAYALAAAWFAKLDASHRRLDSGDFRPETTIRLSTGFVY